MSTNGSQNRMTTAYRRMLERLHDQLERIEAGERELEPAVRRAIDHASETMVQLGELTRDEAHWVAEYLRRDLHDAADHLRDERNELGSWLRFDLSLLEDRLADVLAKVVDRSRLELARFASEDIAGPARYHAGEVAGPGTLACIACGAIRSREDIAPITPCDECGGTVFTRARGDEHVP